MLSVKLDSALKVGAPPPGQPFPKESKKLGVEVCLLPNTDTREWQEESPRPCDSEDLGEKDVGGDDVAPVIEDALSGAVLNGGGGGGGNAVAGEGGEAGLQREGSDWDVTAGGEGEEGAGLKQAASAAAASSEQP